MIELILTNTLDSAPILEKLKTSRAQAKRHILFVPDRFSLSYQKAALEYLNIKGTFDIEVTSFPRLANQLLKGKSRLLDKQSEVMLLRKVIEDNKSDLLCFSRLGRNGEFVSDLYAAISQIRNSNIPVERMAKAAEELPTRIANKTKDIVKVYGDYVKFLQDGYADGTSKLQVLAELIGDGLLNDCNIYVSDFLSFSSVEYEILKALMLNSMNTYISLVDGGGENSQVFPYDVKAKLLSLAEQSGAGVKISYVNQTLGGDAALVLKGLYGYGKVSGERDNKMRVTACADISQEVKSVAREINELIRNGARYKDIAIVCCDFAGYAPYIKSAFDAFSIPFYADIKQPLKTQAASKLIVCAMRTVIEGFAQAQTLEYAKSSFVTPNSNDACIFENYCLKYGIEYTRFLSPFTIGDDLTMRETAENVRKKVVESLSPLSVKEGRGKDLVKALKDYLEKINIQSKVEELAQKQSDNGYEELSSITLQSFGKLNNIFNQFEAMLGESKMDLEEFLGIITTAIESVETSNIPLYLDSVFIGESSESRYENIDYMFIIGAVSGKFPIEHSDNGIVSERECAAWSRMGIDVQPDCRRRNSRERLNTLMTLTRAKKGLRVSYAESGAGGEHTQPSSTVHYLCELLDISPERLEIPNAAWQESDYAKYISAAGNVTEELLYINFLIKSGYLPTSDVALQVEDKLYALACERDGKDYVDLLLAGYDEEEQLKGMSEIAFKGSHTSVSQFEKYFKCPFLHFNENVLRLTPREVSGLEVKDTGILLHSVLEKYFSLKDCADKSEGDIEKVVPVFFREAVREVPDYAHLLDDPTQTQKLQQLVAQSVYVVKNLVKNMRITKFRPKMVEASFGADCPKFHDLKGMEIDSGYRKLSFEGVIDRIDMYKDRAIIIDYKSKYRLNFAPSNILYGDRIQLFVYLNALRRNGDITPQGAFYLLMNNRFVSSDDSEGRFAYRGFVNPEEEYLADLDEGFAAGMTYSANIYPIKRKVNERTGEVTYASQPFGELLDTKGFEDACDYVMKLTQKAAREIEEGYIAKSPLNIGGDEVVKSCVYCGYANVCARSKIKPRNVKKANMDELAQITGGDNVGNKLD